MIRTFLITIFCFCFACSLMQAQDVDTLNIQQLREVEISAQVKPSVSLSSTPLQVMSNDEILQHGMQSLSDAMRRFNGIVLKDYGGIGGLKTVSIRGMGAEHTAVSYDGVVVSNVQSGQVDIGRFSLDNISMLSLNIGESDNIFQTAKSFASAGVLNLQTLTPIFKGRINKGHARMTGGSYGLFNPMIDYSQKLNETFVLSANGSWQHADGNYPFTQKDDKILTDRKRKNSDVDIYRTEMNLYSDFKNAGKLNAKVYFYDSERGLPGNVTLGDDYAAERLWDKNFFTQLSYNRALGEKLKIKSQAKYDYTYTRYEDVHEKYQNGRLRNKYKEQEVYLSNALLYSLNENFSFSFAEDLSYQNLRNEIQQFGHNLPLPERKSSHTALAGQYKTNRLIFTSSLLATYITEEVKNNHKASIYKKISPFVGASYQLFNTNLRVRAFYKHIYRVPTFSELYYSSASKKLNPELAKQMNLGLTWVGEIHQSPLKYLNISADVYQNSVKDKIVIIPKTFVATTMNIGEVDIKGLDVRLAANVEMSKKMNLDLTFTYSYMQAEDVTNAKAENYKNQLPYTPKHSGAGTLTLNNPWLMFSYSVIATDKRYSLPINSKSNKVDAYTDHSISLYREFEQKGFLFYMQGNVLNIWNKRYDVIAYYPMPGRSFKLSAGIKF